MQKQLSPYFYAFNTRSMCSFCFVGIVSEFVVNTCKAGSGALSVTIDGPSKAKMDCTECPEGYRVSYTPYAPGNYLISIRYGGPQHIVGSPFKAKVTGKITQIPFFRLALFNLNKDDILQIKP